MRMMIKGIIPTDQGNKTMRDQTMASMMKARFDDIQPEAAYYYFDEGRRAFMMVFDMKDSSELPPLAEPMFHGTEAELEVTPVMNFDDVMKGMEEAAPKLEQYMK